MGLILLFVAVYLLVRCPVVRVSANLENGLCIIQGEALGWTRPEDQPGVWIDLDALEDPPVPTGRTLNVGEPSTLDPDPNAGKPLA